MSKPSSTKSGPSWYNPIRAYGAVKSYFTSSKPTNDDSALDPKPEVEDIEDPATAPVDEPLPENIVAEVSDIAEICGQEDISANPANPRRKHHRHRHGASRQNPVASPDPVPQKYDWA